MLVFIQSRGFDVLNCLKLVNFLFVFFSIDIQALGWKKCIQFSYCSRIPCGQTAGFYN